MGAAWGGTIDCDLARLYLAKGKSNPIYYRKAIDICPGYIRPYELLGNAYRKEGNFKEAIHLFKSAAELGSTNYKLYYLLAALLYKEKITDESLFYLNKSLELNSTYPKSNALRKEIYDSFDDKGPSIQLFEPPGGATVRVADFYDVFTIRGRILDISKIDRIKVNNVAIGLDESGRFLADVRLKAGMNRLIVTAKDQNGNTSSTSATIIRAEDITDGRIYRKSYAVVIGINRYQNWPPLYSAVADAMSVKRSLELTGFDQVTTILEQEATQRRILTLLYDELPNKVARDDRIVFYFAGHGGTQTISEKNEKGFIIPFESSQTDFPVTAISMDQIRSLSDRIAAKHLFFVMDCCYSGHLMAPSKRDTTSKATGNQFSRARRVIQILTAGAKDQVALENDGHGLFTEHFLNALGGQADQNNDQVVTGSELGQHLPPLIGQLTDQFQTPLFSQIEGEGDILFFLNDEGFNISTK
jgi:hypothetical protein